MQKFTIEEYDKLIDNGYKYVMAIVHQSKKSHLVNYLYPFKNHELAVSVAEECRNYHPLLIEVNGNLKDLAYRTDGIRTYLTSFNDLLKRADYFDNSEIHFTLFDKELNVIDVNESLLRDFHLQREQLIGKNYKDLSRNATESGMYANLQEVITTGKPAAFEELQGDPKYGGRYNRIKAFKVADGVGVSSSDITQLKEMIKTLEMFAYRSSHDIRSPINSILGMIELINSSSERDADQLLRYLDIIKSQVQKLNELTRSLMDTLKTEEKDLKVEPIDFHRILDEVKESLCFIDGFNEVSFFVEIHSAKDFIFDKTLINSLFQNLVDNAIKFRRKDIADSYIKINIDREGDFIKIIIADNGIGIEPEKQKAIFNKFFRATGAAPGNGMGLYTIRSFIERIGGHITLSSKFGDGTAFTIYLPVLKGA